MSLRVTILLSLCVLVAGCGRSPDVDKPTPPDMSAVVAQYDAPTANLDETFAAGMAAYVDQTIADLGVVCGWSSVEDLVCPGTAPCNPCAALDDLMGMLDGLEESPGEMATAATFGDVTVDGEGFVRATRICGGLVPDEVDAANGRMVLVAGFTESGLDAVVFGGFSGCRYLVAGREVVVNLTVHIYVGSGVSADAPALDTLDVIVDVEGSIEVDGVSSAIDLDFKVSPDRGLILRPVVDGKHVFVGFDNGRVFVDALNGTWTCDFVGLSCVDAQGEMLSWSP